MQMPLTVALRVEARLVQSQPARGVVSSLHASRIPCSEWTDDHLEIGEHVDAEKYKRDVFPDVLDVMKWEE